LKSGGSRSRRLPVMPVASADNNFDAMGGTPATPSDANAVARFPVPAAGLVNSSSGQGTQVFSDDAVSVTDEERFADELATALDLAIQTDLKGSPHVTEADAVESTSQTGASGVSPHHVARQLAQNPNVVVIFNRKTMEPVGAPTVALALAPFQVSSKHDWATAVREAPKDDIPAFIRTAVLTFVPHVIQGGKDLRGDVAKGWAVSPTRRTGVLSPRPALLTRRGRVTTTLFRVPKRMGTGSESSRCLSPFF
jgi:hypothetical protein